MKGRPFLSSSFQKWINNSACCPSPLLLGKLTAILVCVLTAFWLIRGMRWTATSTHAGPVSEGQQSLWQIGAWSRAGGADVLICCLASSWWNLNNARLVNDASTAVAFLYDSDDPRSARRPLTSSSGALTLHLRAKLGRLLSGQTHQQPAWREGEEEGF